MKGIVVLFCLCFSFNAFALSASDLLGSEWSYQSEDYYSTFRINKEGQGYVEHVWPNDEYESTIEIDSIEVVSKLVDPTQVKTIIAYRKGKKVAEFIVFAKGCLIESDATPLLENCLLRKTL